VSVRGAAGKSRASGSPPAYRTDAAPRLADVIPTKYNDGKTSELVANVTSSGPNNFKFDLE